MTFILLEEAQTSSKFHYILQTKSCLANKEIGLLFLFNRIFTFKKAAPQHTTELLLSESLSISEIQHAEEITSINMGSYLW